MGKVRETAYKSFYNKLMEKYADITKKADEETKKLKENSKRIAFTILLCEMIRKI